MTHMWQIWKKRCQCSKTALHNSIILEKKSTWPISRFISSVYVLMKVISGQKVSAPSLVGYLAYWLHFCGIDLANAIPIDFHAIYFQVTSVPYPLLTKTNLQRIHRACWVRKIQGSSSNCGASSASVDVYIL